MDLYQNSILFRQNRDVTDKMSNKDRIAELQAANQQAEADGDLGAHGELLNSLGLALKDAGRFNESETAFRESLQVVDQFMEALHRARAQVHSNLGLLSRDRGDLDDAVSLYQQAQREYETIGDDAGAAGMLVEAGIVHKDASRLSEAIACLQQGLSGLSEDEQPTRYAAALVGLGLVFEWRHDYDQARAYYERALPIYRRDGDSTNEAVVLFNLGTLHDLKQEYAEALRYFEQSLAASEAEQDRMGIVHSRSAIGSVLLARGETDNARKMLEQAFAEARDIGYRRAELDALHDLAIIDRNDGDLARAAERLLECQQLAEEFGDPAEVNKAAFDRGDVLLTAGEYEEAAASYTLAADAIEGVRSLLRSEAEALDVLDDAGLEVYDRIVRLKATLLASPREALLWSERCRSREFLRRLRWREISVPANVEVDVVAEEQNLLERARESVSRWESVDGDDRLSILRELDSQERALEVVWERMARTVPEYAALRRGETVTWMELLECLSH